jgi:hypothetical protein
MRLARLLPLLLLLPVFPQSPDGPSSTPVRSGEAPAIRIESARTGTPPEDPYVEDQLLVAPPPGWTLMQLSETVEAEVLFEVGRSGYGVLRVDDAATSSHRLEALGAISTPLGRMVGAGKNRTASRTSTAPPPRPSPDLWHQGAMVLPSTSPGDLSGWVVAVLDSGIAYETRPGYVQATGLSTSLFVDPLDLVELDGHPNDDHQHGTHIASLIASKGWIQGVAPGVSLMPIKVLDRDNQGTEWALVEGLHHAIDHGADVINLSVSFPLGYLPSVALQDALVRASEAGVVVVAAAGNDGASELTWPAASRLVIAVGATSPTAVGAQTASLYTNRSPRVDVLAPGGNLSADHTGDTWVDGILAETIEPGDPSRLGYWFYQGTSQATALVSGAAVRLLASGVSPHDVGPTLQAEAYDADDTPTTGFGVPRLDVDNALDHENSALDVLVGVLPWLGQQSDGTVLPSAQVVVLDANGEPLDEAEVVVTVTTTDRTTWTVCETEEDGQCRVALAPTSTEEMWAFRVDTVDIDHVAYRPGKVLFASDGAEVLLSALELSELSYDTLAVYWAAGPDAELGSMASSFAIVDAGVGAATSPLAVLVAEGGLLASQIELVPLDLDGTGLLSSPLGFTTIRRVTLDGSGLLSSPLGFRQVTLAGLDGTGLLSSPLGFHATQLYTRGSGLLSSPLGLVDGGTAVRLDTGRAVGASLEGTTLLQRTVDELGLRTADGYEPASLVIATGAVEVGLRATSASEMSGSTDPVRWTP